jgi:crotonobetainyl-CoA:carnitine CoA-transferase CaiB-like acyl-CoA transferase
MDASRVQAIAEAGGWSGDERIEITAVDPVLPTPRPVGDVAAVALARAGGAAARLAERAGGDPGPTRVTVADAAAATVGFAVMSVDGETMARTNADNAWVGRYRCADGRWIHLHGGFPPLADRLAELLGLPVDADGSGISAAVSTWNSDVLEDAVADVLHVRGPNVPIGPAGSSSRGRRADCVSTRSATTRRRCCRVRPPTTRPDS